MNLSNLMSYSLGDKEFVRSTTEIFIVESEKTLEQLKEAGQKKDWERVNRFAHSLKSNYATLEMEDLKNIALSIEEDTKNHTGKAKDIMRKINMLNRKTHAVYPSLRHKLELL
ncbi:MAG: Hpt domain-containing protein [Bacteroidota bacterium]